MRYLGTAAATAMVAAAVFLLRGPARAAEVPDTTAPTGAVVGVRDPASGTLQLLIYATDAGAGLASAEVSLDGDSVSFAQLAGSSVSGVPLPVDTHAVSDGSHQLVVEVTDAAGNTAKLLDQADHGEQRHERRPAPTATRRSASPAADPAGRKAKGHHHRARGRAARGRAAAAARS